MKILVRLPNWLGDLVMSSAFVRALRRHYPESRIDAIVKAELLPVARHIGQIEALYPFSKKENRGLRGVYRFGRKLKKNKYDLFFSLPDSFSSALMGWASGARTRVGYRKEGRALLLTQAIRKPAGLHRVDEYLFLLGQDKAVFTPKNQVRLHADAERTGHIVINFNSEAISRRMPVEKGRVLLRDLLTAFPERQFICIGGPNERAHIDAITTGFPADLVQNRAGQTSFDQLIDLMAAAACMLSTDSGPAHLANAVGTPLLVLFGAGNENNTAPFNPENRGILRLNALPCEPCVKNTCIFGLPKCLQMLDNMQIISRLQLLDHAN